MNVVYQRQARPARPFRRYQVQYRDEPGNWNPASGPGYWTLFFAKKDVWRWNRIGYEARVIDWQPGQFRQERRAA